MWSFILTDRSFVPRGEILNLYDRKVALPLSRLSTASFRVRSDNPLADRLVEQKGYVKGYYNGSLEFFGDIVTTEEVGDEKGVGIAVNCVDGGWALSKRLTGKSANGTVIVPLTDRAQIIKQLIDTANTESETGISTTAKPMNAGASMSNYQAGPYKPISECLNELATPADGFDWRVVPVENFVNGAVSGTKFAAMWAQGVIGTIKPVYFEYGIGRHNVTSYTRRISREEQANRVYHIASGGPEVYNNPVVSATDSTSVSQWRRLEALASADLIDQNLRQSLVNEHVAVRSQPRQIVEFTPAAGNHPGVPRFKRDFDVGDFVTGRIGFEERVRLDSLFRIWGLAFEMDNNGKESMTLTLVEEGS